MADVRLLRILLVEDDAVYRMLIRRLVGSEFQIEEAATLKEAKAKLTCGEFDCVLLDYRLPDGTGLDLLAQTTELQVPAIMMTAMGHQQLSAEALDGGCHEYLIKDDLTRVSLIASLTSAVG